MSCIFPSLLKKSKLDADKIAAFVQARGGQIVERGARVALAIVQGRPALILMEGHEAGTLALLTNAGLGPRHDIRASCAFEAAALDWPHAAEETGTGRVYDLVAGEARLREVMEAILADIRPQIFALMSDDAAGGQPSDRTGRGTGIAGFRDWQNKAECLDALAPLLETGRGVHIPTDWVAVVDFLTKDLGEDVREWLKVGDAPALTHLVLATPGLGKTRAVQDLIEALPSEAVIWVFQPTLRKAREFARDMAGSPRPVRVFRGRGASVAEGAIETMCTRHTLASAVAEKGLSVKKMLCGIRNDGAAATCPDAAACPYQAQIRAITAHQGGGIFVMTHASLTHPPPLPEPHLVIIDEDPSMGLYEEIEVGAELMGAESAWATLLYEQAEDVTDQSDAGGAEDTDLEEDRGEEAVDAVMDTIERLRDGLAAAAPLREIAATVEIVELEAALKMVRRLERKLGKGLQPERQDQAVLEALEASPTSALRAIQAVLSAILQEVRRFSSDVINRETFNGLSICHGDDGRIRSITVHRLARTALTSTVPVIVLDGTADPIVLGRALRRRMTVWRIDVARQGEVVQCVGRGFSTTSLVPDECYPAPAFAREESDRLWQELTTVLRREADAAPNGVLVVSTLSVETEARRRQCCDDLLGARMDWTHFGATRGINAFTDRQTVILIGRKQPPASAVQALARACYALDPKPFDFAESDYVVRRRTLYTKKGQTSSTTIQLHPDIRIHRLLWQMREAEVIQAIDRVRAVRFPRRILILNSLDLRRPDVRDPGLGVPADLHMSWPELRNGRNRAETVLAVTGGLLPVAPRALAYIAPEIFSSLEAAKKWLHRTNLDKALVRHADHLTRIHVRRKRSQSGCEDPSACEELQRFYTRK